MAFPVLSHRKRHTFPHNDLAQWCTSLSIGAVGQVAGAEGYHPPVHEGGHALARHPSARPCGRCHPAQAGRSRCQREREVWDAQDIGTSHARVRDSEVPAARPRAPLPAQVARHTPNSPRDHAVNPGHVRAAVREETIPLRDAWAGGSVPPEGPDGRVH